MYGTHHSSTGQALMTFGNEAVGVHHTIQTRLANAEHMTIISTIRDENAGSGLRNRLGGAMIALGTLVAGKSAHMQERHATTTMPSPSPKSGFVPLR